MQITSGLIKIIVSVFLLIGGVIFLFLIISQLGVSVFLSYLWPSLIFLTFIVITIIGPIRYLLKKDKIGENLLSICLLMQSISFHIAGFQFKNHFGGYLGLNLLMEPDFRVSFDYDLFSYNFANGYIANNTSLLTINLVPVLILVLISLLEEKEKKTI